MPEATLDSVALTTPSSTGRILIIDDEPSIRESLEVLLTLEGFEVDLAPEGRTGLDMLAASEYDLLLLDLALPGESGIDLLPRIKRLRPQVPVIMITAYGTVGNVVDALHAGADNFVQKPWDNEKLLADMRAAMAQYRSAEEVVQLKRTLKQRYSFENIIGKSDVMTKLLETVAQGGSITLHSVDPRGKRDRQGVNCEGDPPELSTQGQAFRRNQHWSGSSRPVGVDTFWTREGCFYFSDCSEERSV